MHLKLKVNKKTSLSSGQKRTHRKSQNMASSLVNDDEDNATTTTSATTTRNTQQQHQQQQSNNINATSNNNNNSANCLNQQNTNTTTTKMHGNESKLKKENLQQRKQDLEKLLNEKSWLLQQLQKQEAEILNGNFEYMNFNDFISNLAIQYKQEQQSTDADSTAGGVSQFSANEDAILRRKPLTAKENHQQLQHNVIHRRQSEISNRSSEYDNYPHHDTLSTHSDGAASSAGRSGHNAVTMHQAPQAQQQYNPKSALKKRSATVAGTTQQQTMANLQMHLRHQQQQQQQQQQQNLEQQHLIYKQHHYHHPQQHLFKQHVEHHQVLMPHLQYATQKFYYTTLQPQTQSQSPQQQQPQYGRYLKAQTVQQHNSQQQQQQQQQHQQQHQQQSPQHNHIPQNAQQQSPTRNNQQHHILYTTNQMSLHPSQQQQLLLTPPHAGSSSASSAAAVNMDSISLYSLNSNNVATLHRQAQQQLPIIVQCDKYYLSPTTHHVSHNDGGGFIKSSQNIKEYISPLNSPQNLAVMAQQRDRKLVSQSNLSNRAPTNTPSIDAISLAPSYMSMETVEYISSPTSSQQQLQQQQQQQHQHTSNMRWRSQTNLPPSNTVTNTMSGDMKSHSSDMLNNNNQYYHMTATNQQPPPPVTQVKPFKPLDEISINSYTSETQKKTTKPKQWMESSLDGPVIRQTPQHMDNNNDTNIQIHSQRSKLSSQSLNTARHYSMSAAQAKLPHSTSGISNNAGNTKLSQSTSYLNQLEATTPASTCSISQAYNVEEPPTQSYKYLTNQTGNNNKSPPPRPPLYINASSSSSSGGGGTQQYQNLQVSPLGQTLTIATSPCMLGMSTSSGLSPDIRIESPKNMTVVQPATFQPYKEVTKPFEMSDFYKYSTKYRQKENSSTAAQQQN